jgi:hypothetical protein
MNSRIGEHQTTSHLPPEYLYSFTTPHHSLAHALQAHPATRERGVLLSSRQYRFVRSNVHRLLLLLAIVIGCAACGDDSPTSPSSTSTTSTQTAASPATTEEFDSTVPVGGSKFYSFTTTTYGTIQITLTGVSGSFVPSTVMLGVGLGQPSGTDCVTTTSVNTAAGTTPQVTGVYDAGVYCAKVADIGNLYAPASFTATIAYP